MVLLGILIVCVSSIYTCLSYENTVISIEIFDAEEGVYARVTTVKQYWSPVLF
uniref:Uncharacterized protein n=1 Tax=Arundo donax TaxID=35708 RepID=A0A0A9HYX8_ARUDO